MDHVEEIPTGTLMARTLELLESSDQTVLELYQATGLNYYWLRRFKQGKIPDPSVNRVQILYEYLTNRKLKVQ